ncbi:branched-chain amino acid ABC transporter permease [Lactobacillus sp. ESL0228]|uniref:branched-chain amino acid ABC transporter permease n=1 Tax=Lactobacillus sp. ESL0228 TaxID=2069352 RepID=UPI000EFCD571|nr:branched-chain amino acid ABC transporter permease [Lactobacillus sp. ESL0228]RMC51815.1 branched-chain amino acid ABC transporter permease [Lactobacillus sp. ESL0228]
MQIFLQQIINALSLGSIYALLALGYSMVYGIIKLINFAHGDIYMLGAFCAYFVINTLHLNFIMALFSAMIFGALLGVIIEYLAYRPLRKSPRITVLITAIGVSFLLENGMSYFVGSNARSFPQVIEQVNYNVGGVLISNIQILILVTSLSLMILLQIVIKKTSMGRAMRAVSVDPEAAELVGINVNHTISFTFALGSALAGAAGILIGMYYNSIDPLMGMTPGIKAFVAAVLGGIGSVPGASLGGFLIGILETFFQSVGLSAYKDAVVYLILIIILLFFPAGIFGKNIKEKV